MSDLWLQAELLALARDVLDAIGAAEKYGGFLDRASRVDCGPEVLDIHLSPVRAVVNPP
jgi:hypothetical protein